MLLLELLSQLPSSSSSPLQQPSQPSVVGVVVAAEVRRRLSLWLLVLLLLLLQRLLILRAVAVAVAVVLVLVHYLGQDNLLFAVRPPLSVIVDQVLLDGLTMWNALKFAM